jgi:hypothetical protein
VTHTFTGLGTWLIQAIADALAGSKINTEALLCEGGDVKQFISYLKPEWQRYMTGYYVSKYSSVHLVRKISAEVNT